MMKLEFPEDEELKPMFSELARFKTIGVVTNVFLLDPLSRLLAAFVWISSSNTVGLYALLDWSKEEYVFIDTGLERVSAHASSVSLCLNLSARPASSSWTCERYKEQIVIHFEDSNIVRQHFYPIYTLRKHVRPSSIASTFATNTPKP